MCERKRTLSFFLVVCKRKLGKISVVEVLILRILVFGDSNLRIEFEVPRKQSLNSLGLS